MSTSMSIAPSSGIALQASIEEIDAELRRTGVFHYSHEYLKDRHFEQYVLAPSISTMDQVHQLLEILENDHKARAFSFGETCTKAYSVHRWIGGVPDTLDDLTWARIGLAKARRTCCSCHQTGSFHPQ